MIGTIASFLGVSTGVVKWAGGGLAIVAALVAFTIWKSDLISDAIDGFVTEANLESEERAREADNANAQQQRKDDARITAEGDELEGVLDDDPDAEKPVDDATRDFLRCVQRQQTARANGEPVPAC